MDVAWNASLLALLLATIGLLATALFRLDAKIDGLGARLDAKIDGLAERIDRRFDRVDDRLSRVDLKLEEHLRPPR